MRAGFAQYNPHEQITYDVLHRMKVEKSYFISSEYGRKVDGSLIFSFLMVEEVQ